MTEPKDPRLIKFIMDDDEYLTLKLIEMKTKTSVYGIFSRKHGDKLGEVRWWGKWRQYCFFPAHDTVFNRDCIGTIQAFLEHLHQLRKSEKKKL